MFHSLNDGKGSNLLKYRMHALHSVLDEKEQELALEPAALDECKMVLATNVTETSLTILDMKVVIDLGFARRMHYDDKKQSRVLQLDRCPQSSARQRIGHAGRMPNGAVLRLYSRSIWEEQMNVFDDSELYPLDYTMFMVQGCPSRYGSIHHMMQSLIEPRLLQAVETTAEKPLHLGILGPMPDLKITPMSVFALQLPVEVMLARVIYCANFYGCAAEMVVIAEGLSPPGPLVRPQSHIFHPSHFEYQRACFEASESIFHFDKGRCNDMHSILPIYEAEKLHLPFDR